MVSGLVLSMAVIPVVARDLEDHWMPHWKHECLGLGFKAKAAWVRLIVAERNGDVEGWNYTKPVWFVWF